MARKEVK